MVYNYYKWCNYPCLDLFEINQHRRWVKRSSTVHLRIQLMNFLFIDKWENYLFANYRFWRWVIKFAYSVLWDVWAYIIHCNISLIASSRDITMFSLMWQWRMLLPSFNVRGRLSNYEDHLSDNNFHGEEIDLFSLPKWSWRHLIHIAETHLWF